MNRKHCLAAVVVAAAALLAAPAVHALINPKFTPIHLTRESALIAWVDIKAGEPKDLHGDDS